MCLFENYSKLDAIFYTGFAEMEGGRDFLPLFSRKKISLFSNYFSFVIMR